MRIIRRTPTHGVFNQSNHRIHRWNILGRRIHHHHHNPGHRRSIPIRTPYHRYTLHRRLRERRNPNWHDAHSPTVPTTLVHNDISVAVGTVIVGVTAISTLIVSRIVKVLVIVSPVSVKFHALQGDVARKVYTNWFE